MRDRERDKGKRVIVRQGEETETGREKEEKEGLHERERKRY